MAEILPNLFADGEHSLKDRGVSLYNGRHQLQDRLRRRLADRIEEQDRPRPDRRRRPRLHRARDMFFIATVGPGRPAAAFVQRRRTRSSCACSTSRTIAFPALRRQRHVPDRRAPAMTTKKVGLLFIDFEGRKRACGSTASASVAGRRSAARGVSRGAARSSACGATEVFPELPALHPRVQARHTLALRAGAECETPVRRSGDTQRLGARRLPFCRTDDPPTRPVARGHPRG